MRRFRRWPPAVGSGFVAVAVLPGGDLDPRQLKAKGRGPVADVIGIIVRQPRISQLLRDLEAAKYLHGAGGDMIAFHARRFAGGASAQ